MTPLAPVDHLKLTAAVLAAVEPYLMSVQTLPVVTAKVEEAIYRHYHPTAEPKPAEPQ